jgi:hypothetical protein
MDKLIAMKTKKHQLDKSQKEEIAGKISDFLQKIRSDKGCIFVWVFTPYPTLLSLIAE